VSGFLKDKRLCFVVSVFLLVVVALLYRMLELTLFDQSFLQKQGKARSIRRIKTPAVRGMISDRNDIPLAVSTPVDSIWINPQEFQNTKEQVMALSTLLSIPYSFIEKRILSHQHKQFLYLKRDVDPQLSRKADELKFKGVYLKREYRRYYPQAEVTAQLLGITNIDDKGQEGLELAYNNWLTGTPGEEKVEQDLLGNVIRNLEKIKEQKSGRQLNLSVDNRIQFIAYQALQKATRKFKAKSASAVVLDVKTGEVLAMVNYPSFNPNNARGQFDSNFKNRAMTDVFEPGSTMKAFSILSALDSGKYTPDTVIDASPGWLKVGKNWVHDELNYGVLTVTGVLQKSSNVGAAKMTISLPGDQLWDVLHRVGFGEKSSSNFPGERSGYIVHQDPWRPFALATLAFGYGISVNTLQMAHAYSVIGNHGKIVPITLLKREKPVQGEQVIAKDSANQMLTMLESVVAPGGTGRRAAVTGYRVAGKTGTAKMAGPNGYYKHKYVGSFVGMAPVSDPQIVVAVVLNDLTGKEYYGGLVAAPAFSTIMAGSLRVLDIPPDQRSE
jgi:cell division protein FtsI (penicillin-binding protein 3)